MLATASPKRPRFTIRHAATTPQREFITSSARTSAFIGGIGSGKTRASVLKALAQPRGTPGMLVAPTYPMLKDALLTTFLEIARPLIREFNKSDLDITLADGKRIAFRSADNPDRLRGPNLAWAGLDEAALMDKSALDIMLGRLRLAPGRMWFTTTPKGRNHWLHEYAHRENVHTVKARSMDNPYLPVEFLEDLKRAYASDFYRQEVLGEFVEDGGLVFKDAFYYDTLPDGAYREAVGVDFAYTAKSHADYSVAIAGRAYGDTLYLANLVRMQAELPAFGARLRALGAPRYLARIGGTEKGVVQLLKRDLGIRLDTIPASTDKFAFAQPVAAAWNAGKVLLPRNAPWVDELLAEVLTFTGVNDPHDDQVDALGALHHAHYIDRLPDLNALRRAAGTA